MEFVAIDTIQTSSPEWFRIPADARGHWLSLMSVCALRENGGRFVDCKDWTGRDWDRIAGLTRAALAKLERFGLVHRSGPDLLVRGYDVERESSARRTSEQRRAAAKKRWSRSEATPAELLDSGDAARTAIAEAGEVTRSAVADARSEPCNAGRNAEERRGEERRASASRTSKPSAPKEGKKTGAPIPFTVADLLTTLETNANGRIAVEQFGANPKRWAAQLTKTIRELDAAGYGLADVASAARLIAEWKSARPLNWLVSGGNLIGACKSARLATNSTSEPRRIGGLTA